MKYIVHKRFKNKAICGEVDLPVATTCESEGVVIKYDGSPICCVGSENAHQFFAIDEDGMGIERGELTQAIQKTLFNRDDEYQARWDKVWSDPICQGYKRTDYDDFWLWSHDFFNADIGTLRHIANLIGVVL